MTLAYREHTIPDSPPARWDARWKLAAMLIFAVSVAFLRTPLFAALAFFCVSCLLLITRVRIRRILERMGLLILAVLPFLIVLPLLVDHGWFMAGMIVFRCVTIGLIAFFILSTTRLDRMLTALRSLGTPGVIVQIAQLSYRYTQVLFGEARRLRVALAVRAFRLRTNRHTYRTMGHVAGALIVSGGERAERVAAAMKSRGFHGTPRLISPFRTHWTDIVAFVLVVTVAISLVVGER